MLFFEIFKFFPSSKAYISANVDPDNTAIGLKMILSENFIKKRLPY